MTLLRRWFGTPNLDETVFQMLIKEVSEARKDAVRMAEMSNATLDRIVTARYDRPERPLVIREDRSPMAAQASVDDDAVWLKNAGIVSDPER